MEQTVNTFKGGLQSDTSPMVQGNDSLSDALNATFVTMNGNEIVLQNDMGNRRVDNAYLPSGYEPVGIKEYGGIIYIAAYNPITNRSLIGSFPSPERRISKNDGLGNSDINFNFEFNSSNSLGINCLVTDTLLFPLTKDTSLHAGDKFIVYGGLDNTDKITNYNNITGDKVTSPKNKQYTLALGILNSENLFVDITSSLVRWNNGEIMDLDDKTDLYKFNAGYFIKSNAPETNSELELTENDALLAGERENAYQVMKANTYSYKLVGPLYLQVKYNHILDFSYNIYGTYDKITKKAELFVEGFITYNCPDNLESGGRSDSNYSTYAEGEVSENFGFDFMVNEEVKSSSFLEEIKRETKYNPETNLYLVKIVKKISELSPDENNLINYIIGVKANLNEGEYLYGLSSRGSIDVTKLGSGEIELTGWRFTNNYNNKTGTITYTLDAYPKYNEEFKNFKILFTNVEGGDKIELDSPANNGKTNLNVTWTTDKTLSNLLLDRALYKVTITYDIYNKTTGESVEESKSLMKKIEEGELEVKEFYLTTELFNSCYSPNSSDFIPDYGYPDGKTPISDYEVPDNYDPNDNSVIDPEDPERETKLSERIIYKKLVIIPNITTSSKLQESSIKEGREGSLIHMSDEDYDITTIYKKDINVTFTVNLDANEILYPDYIKVKHELEEGDFKFEDDYPLSNVYDNITHQGLNDEIGAEEDVDKERIWNKYISVLTWKDSVTVKNRKLYEGPMTNVFDSFYNYINSQTNNDFLSHSGIVLFSQGVWGPDHHGIYVTIDLTSPIASSWPNERNNGEIMIMEHSEDLDSNSRWQEAKRLFNLSLYDLLDYFSNIKEGKVFAFVAQDGNNSAKIALRPPKYGENLEDDIPGYLTREYVRLMWKSTIGWAYVDIQIPINIGSENLADANVKKYLLEGDLGDIFKKIYYRRFKTLDSSSIDKTYYVPKGIDYEPYSKMFTLKYKVSLNLEENKGIEIKKVNPVLLNFKIVDIQKDEEKTEDIFLIQSGENFVDLINTEFSFNRCVLEDGAIADSDGNEFLVGSVYVKGNDDKYHKVEDSFPVKPYNTDQNESFLTCVSNKGSLKLLSDFRLDDDEDSISWATYDVVDRISLDDLKLRINAY